MRSVEEHNGIQFTDINNIIMRDAMQPQQQQLELHIFHRANQ